MKLLTAAFPVTAALLALGLGALALPARAQGPHEDWRTIETGRFRVHYPAASEAWARHAAARLESIWARVEEEVGYKPPDRLDVLVLDPVAQPNGAALPFLGWPRMLLFSSPPGPESTLGHYTDWADLLLVHEGTHLVHLLRRSRNPSERLLARLLPIGPLTLRAPRWVTEGYATVVEGRLTGSGRPNSDLRAAILRRRAQQGQLPGYGDLNDDERWMGSSMAYLMGSAYLEWLDQRAGPGSLPKLWARMSARERRTFAEAFEGVYGDSPSRLYGRFVAELTYDALAAEHALAPVLREGELWQDLSWSTGDPAVSPSGDRLAIVLRSDEDPDELVVWSTGPNEEGEKEWREEREKIARRDPEDVPAVRSRPLSRDPLYRLPEIDGIAPTSPRFLPDGKAILFVRFEPDADGILHPDLFRWDLPAEKGGAGRVKRLTRQADLREPDPGPDGTWAVAVRNRHGFSQIVRVDLASGEVTPVTEATIETIYDRPRVSPDGSRVAFALHREGQWRLAVRDLATGEQQEIAPPLPGATLSFPAWGPGGKVIYAAVGEGGVINLWAFPVDPPAPASRVTRVYGAAMAPEPAPDGQGLFFLSLEDDGLDLRRLDLAAGRAAGSTAETPEPELDRATLAPVLTPPPPPAPAPFARAEIPPGRPYGLGRQELRSLSGGRATSSGATFELGARLGDVIGRLDVIALGSPGGQGSPKGGAVAAAWRGWPVELSLHLFSADEQPSEQRGDLPLGGLPLRGLDVERTGAELRAKWARQLGSDDLSLETGVLWEENDPRLGVDLDETVAFVKGGYQADRGRGSWSFSPGIWGQWERGEGGGDSWERLGGAVSLGLARNDDALSLTWRRDDSSGVFRPYQLYHVGGSSSSLLPRSALAHRIESPALPVGTLAGFEHEGQRADLKLDAFPVPLFYERHRVGSGGDFGDWLSLAGLEYTFSLGPVPLGGIPALDLRVGAARVLGSPLPGRLYEDETRWWLTVLLRP